MILHRPNLYPLRSCGLRSERTYVQHSSVGEQVSMHLRPLLFFDINGVGDLT
jgi:hypothetical protein